MLREAEGSPRAGLRPGPADVLLAAGVLAAMLMLRSSPGGPTLRGPEDFAPATTGLAMVAACVLAAGAFLLRRTRPILMLAVVVATIVLLLALGAGDLSGVAVIALYSVARHVRRAAVVAGAGAVVLAVLVLAVLAEHAVQRGPEPVTAILSGAGAAALAVLAGRFVRLRAQRAADREAHRLVEAARAVAEERVRIARELHDVVAHRVSIMTVQAGAARTVAARDPAAAREAMRAVEDTGREALDELRRLLGVLRPEGGEAEGDVLPHPGPADLTAMVERFAAAGVQVALRREEAGEVPDAVALVAYRIVQESLTNVLRHAGPGARAEVELTSGTGVLRIAVRDDGGTAAGPPASTVGASASAVGAGRGIVGMRERARMLGGSLEAGRATGRGFQVRAVLPVPGPAPRGPSSSQEAP